MILHCVLEKGLKKNPSKIASPQQQKRKPNQAKKYFLKRGLVARCNNYYELQCFFHPTGFDALSLALMLRNTKKTSQLEQWCEKQTAN